MTVCMILKINTRYNINIFMRLKNQILMQNLYKNLLKFIYVFIMYLFIDCKL